MKTTIGKRTRILFRALALCLCATLAAGCACAEETRVVNLGGNGISVLSYGDTLPDGRILLAGFKDNANVRNYGWLLCLNRDGTVSWEYLDDSDDSRFTRAAVLPDGTIGTVLRPMEAGKNTSLELRFFTADGKPTGKEISVPVDGTVEAVAATGPRLLVIMWGKDDSFTPNLLFDWEGQEIMQVQVSGIAGHMYEEEDGLLMCGQETGNYGRQAGIWKTDVYGNGKWRTLLPYGDPDSENIGIWSVTRTEDGGYLGIQTELMPRTDPEKIGHINKLVKLDSDGNMIALNGEIFSNTTDSVMAFGGYGGKYAVSMQTYDGYMVTYRLDNPTKFCWFDENGTDLGTTELKMKPEDFDWLAEYTEALAEEGKFAVMIPEDDLIALEDGLWMPASVGIVLGKTENGGCLIESDSFREVLVKIPEP